MGVQGALSRLSWLLRMALRGVVFGFLMLAIPIAFEVGGEGAGLAFSMSVGLYYFFLGNIKLLTRDTTVFWVYKVLALSQVVVLPAVLIRHLHEYDRPADPSRLTLVLATPWKEVMARATPFFTLLEGLASLLIVQSLGQVARWATENISETWTLVVLLGSGVSLSGSIYFLFRMSTFATLSYADMALSTAVITAAACIAIAATSSGRGNIAESSALFSYAVYTAYMSLTDYGGPAPALPKPDYEPFPPIVMDGYAQLLSSSAGYIPMGLRRTYMFLSAAFEAISASVLTSFLYRMVALYAAARILPVFADAPPPDVSEGIAVEGSATANTKPRIKGPPLVKRVMSVFTTFWPMVMVSVYTHLLLQHFKATSASPQHPQLEAQGDGPIPPTHAGWQDITALQSPALWRWITIVLVLGIYTVDVFFSHHISTIVIANDGTGVGASAGGGAGGGPAAGKHGRRGRGKSPNGNALSNADGASRYGALGIAFGLQRIRPRRMRSEELTKDWKVE